MMRFVFRVMFALAFVCPVVQMQASAATFEPINPAAVPANRIARDFDASQAAILRSAFQKYLAITKQHGGQMSLEWLPRITVHSRRGSVVDARDIFVYANAVQQVLVANGDSLSNPKYATQDVRLPNPHATAPPPVAAPPPPPPPAPPAPGASPKPCPNIASPPPSVADAWRDISELSSGKDSSGNVLDRCNLPFEEQLTAAEAGPPSVGGLATPLVLTIPISPFQAQSWLNKNFGAAITSKLQFLATSSEGATQYGVILESCLDATTFSHSNRILTVISAARSSTSTTVIPTPTPQNACTSQTVQAVSTTNNAVQQSNQNSPAPPKAGTAENKSTGILTGSTSVYLGPVTASPKPIVNMSSSVNPDYDFAVSPRKDVDLIPPFSTSYGLLRFDVHLLGDFDLNGSVHSDTTGGYVDMQPGTKVYVTGIFSVGNKILGTLLAGTVTAVDAGGDVGAVVAVVPDATAVGAKTLTFSRPPLVLVAYAHGAATINNVMSGSLALKGELLGMTGTIFQTSWPGLLAQPLSYNWGTPWTVIYLANPQGTSTVPAGTR